MEDNSENHDKLPCTYHPQFRGVNICFLYLLKKENVVKPAKTHVFISVPFSLPSLEVSTSLQLVCVIPLHVLYIPT